MKCKGLHKLQFTEDQLRDMRDSVYGYNDELACSIWNGENAGQYVLGHISKETGYNFSYEKYLYRARFHHEFTHLLFGLSNLKRGSNLLPFEYGYDGNGMAEAIVINIQNDFSGFDGNTKSKKAYLGHVKNDFLKRKDDSISSILSAVNIVNNSDVLMTVFNARRNAHFDEMPEISQSERGLLINGKTKYGDDFYKGEDITDEILSNFYDDLKPVILLARRNYQRLMGDPTINFFDTGAVFKDYLKTIPVEVIWDVMNEPDLAETMNLNHHKTLTWEFILLNTFDFKSIMDSAGSMNLRTHIGYDTLAKSGGYQNYSSFKKIKSELEKYIDIIKDGRVVHSFGVNDSVSLESRILNNHKQRKQLVGDLFVSLIEGNITSFRDKLITTSIHFESDQMRRDKLEAQISKSKMTTPSP